MCHQCLRYVLKILDDLNEINRLQKELSEKLARNGRPKSLLLGYQGGSDRHQGYWFPKYGIWWSYGDYGRHWNAFGIADNESNIESKNLSMICQINFPKDKPWQNTAGAFVKDDAGKIFVAHTGGIGGGKKGVGPALFKEYSKFKREYAKGRGGKMQELVLITSLDDKDLISNLGKFVKEIRNIKLQQKSKPNKLAFYRLVSTPDKLGVTKNNSYLLYDPAVSRYRAILEYKKQLIFYGPPGTGKTRMAHILAKSITNPFYLPPLSDQNYEQYIESLVNMWCARHGLKMKMSSNPNVQGTIGEKRFIVVHGSSDPLHQITYKHETSDVWGNVNEEDRFKIVIDSANKHFVVVSYLEEIKMLSNTSSPDKSTISIGLKESDKNTRLPVLDSDSENIIEYLKTISSIDVRSTFPSNDAITPVTFHPSYSYGEFIEGIAPKIDEEKLNYEIKKGIFVRVCKRATDNPSNNYVIIIDEINRGNIPSIFGEIITLLEPDKRYKDGNGYSVRLPYSGEQFGVPPNLYVIGTMNTSDRSLVQIDVALRRRFAFVELPPDYSLLNGRVEGISLSLLVHAINRRLVKNGFGDKQIGHSYFLSALQPSSSQLNVLRMIMQCEIVPLIQDYTYDDYDKMAEILGSEFVDNENKKIKSGWIEHDDVFVGGLKQLVGA